MRTYEDKSNKKDEKNPISVMFIIAGAAITGIVSVASVLFLIALLPIKSYKDKTIIVLFLWIVVFMAAISSSNLISSWKNFIKIANSLSILSILCLLFLIIPINGTASMSARLVYVSSKCFSFFSVNSHAKMAVEEAMSLNSKQYLYPAEAGRLYYEEKDYQKSIDYYSKAIELNPDLDMLYFKRGRVYMDNQDPFSARDDFNKIIQNHLDDEKNNPDDEEYNYWLAKAYLECGYKSGENEDYEKAIEYFGKAIDVNKNNDEYYYQRARAYMEMGGSENNTNAVQDLTKAIDINGNNEDYYYQRGITYYNLGGYNDYTNSINDYTAAIKINDNIKEYYYWRGVSYFGRASLRKNDNDALEDYQESINNFDIAIEIDQEYAECYNERAWSYHWSGNYKAGLMDMKQAVNLDGNNTDYRCNLGNFYYNGDEFKKAIKEYQIAIELEPNESCYFNLGDAYYKLKNYEEAIEAYTNALEYNESNVLYLSRRSLCYSLMGNYEKSRDDLKSIMQLQARGKEIF